MKKVTIIILNWNGVIDTLECLTSLRNVTYPNFNVLIIDNASSGNDVEIIRNRFGGFVDRIIVNKANLGFSGGNNAGIKAAIESGADYVLLLNNDTVVEPDFLTKLIEQKDTLREIGIISPMINYYNAPDTIWSAGGKINKLKASGFTSALDENMKDYRYNTECTFVSGCAMLIKREVIETVGLLDEKYFLYLEDTDYCQRVIDAGYKIYYAGESRVYHKVFSSTARDSELLPLYYSFRNRFYFARKNFRALFYFSSLYLIIVFSVKWAFIYKDKGKTAKVFFQAFNDFLMNKMGQTDIFEERNKI